MGDENESRSKNDKKKSWKGGGNFFKKPGQSSGQFQTPKGDPVLLVNPRDIQGMQWRHFLSVNEFKEASTQLKIQLVKDYLSQKPH